MLFVVNKSELRGALSIVRDDRTKQARGSNGPFLRMEAKGNSLTLDGREVSSKIAATVYEPGVLFLRVTIFRQLLTTFPKDKFLTIQVMSAGLLVGNVTLSLEAENMLLYLNPEQAPRLHPLERQRMERKSKREPTARQLLFWDITPSVPLGPDSLWRDKDSE